ncbi:MAG TPA: phosphoribosyltransferase family protein, partial [Dissulfurispiraceae bacterium]|nr:phosphoribosyltransferase family protein [Dissulfurispiraceae bacterium]
TIEIHTDALIKGANVLLIDDLIATGGTVLAAAVLVEKLGAQVAEMAFIVNLPDVGGAEKVRAKGYKMFALTEFEGE